MKRKQVLEFCFSMSNMRQNKLNGIFIIGVLTDFLNLLYAILIVNVHRLEYISIK